MGQLNTSKVRVGNITRVNVPPFPERIDSLKRLSERVGKDRVVWRFAPLILTDDISKEKLVENVHSIASKITRLLVDNKGTVLHVPSVVPVLNENVE